MASDPYSERGAAVSLRAVSVSYDSAGTTPIPAVSDVDLDVEPGSIVALLGPSGCGKTSLLRAIAGLERPSNGEISIAGAVVSRSASSGKRAWVHPERRNIGMVFQDGALFPHLSVADNVGFGLHVPKAQRAGRIADMLNLVDLGDYRDRMPGTLSGGQQQRVALARSLAPQPNVLLLDEPFSALDTALRVQVRAEVARIVREVGVTTIFVTHDQDEAFVLGDRVAVMFQGEVMQFGTPDELYRKPTSPWVAHFVGEANFVHAQLDSSVATDPIAATPLGSIPVKDHRLDTNDAAIQVLVRPEQIGVRSAADGADDEGTVATIENVEYYGHDVRYELALADGTALAARTKSTELFARGEQVHIRYRSRARGSLAAAFSIDDIPLDPTE